MWVALICYKRDADRNNAGFFSQTGAHLLLLSVKLQAPRAPVGAHPSWSGTGGGASYVEPESEVLVRKLMVDLAEVSSCHRPPAQAHPRASQLVVVLPPRTQAWSESVMFRKARGS